MKKTLIALALIQTLSFYGSDRSERAERRAKRKSSESLSLVTTATAKRIQKENPTCTPCQEKIELKRFSLPKASVLDRSIRLQCGHDYHFGCIAPWTLNGNLSCPNCRAPVQRPSVVPIESALEFTGQKMEEKNTVIAGLRQKIADLRAQTRASDIERSRLIREISAANQSNFFLREALNAALNSRLNTRSTANTSLVSSDGDEGDYPSDASTQPIVSDNDEE